MITYPAKYTVVLKSLLDNEQSKQAIDTALSEYPLFIGNETSKNIIPTREELNTKLLDYYKYREIGFETVGRFIDELRITMNHIMPYYSEMYKTVQIMCDIEDPFGNVDIVETFKQTSKDTSSSEGTSKATGSATSTGTTTSSDSAETTNNGTTTANDSSTANKESNTYHKNVKSDTPQDSLSITADSIYSVKYANEVNWDNETVTGSDTTKGNSSSTTENTSNTQSTGSSSANSSSETENDSTTSLSGSSSGELEHTFTKKGNQGVNTYAHDMIEFRQTVIDITDRIITDKRIAELFMLVY